MLYPTGPHIDMLRAEPFFKGAHITGSIQQAVAYPHQPVRGLPISVQLLQLTSTDRRHANTLAPSESRPRLSLPSPSLHRLRLSSGLALRTSGMIARITGTARASSSPPEFTIAASGNTSASTRWSGRATSKTTSSGDCRLTARTSFCNESSGTPYKAWHSPGSCLSDALSYARMARR